MKELRKQLNSGAILAAREKAFSIEPKILENENPAEIEELYSIICDSFLQDKLKQKKVIPFLEKLLSKMTDEQKILKNRSLLAFLQGDIKNAKLFLNQISDKKSDYFYESRTRIFIHKHELSNALKFIEEVDWEDNSKFYFW